jgi:hypothetical protein
VSNYTALRGGQVNQAGSATAIFLKVFAGEVLTAFHAANVYGSLQMSRSITSGKSASFPVLGTVAASRHTPGNELTFQNADANEKIISIDDLLVAPVFIPNIDEAMSHYDIRGPFSSECGIALATVYDRIAAQVVYLAARSAATLTSGQGGGNVIDASAGTVSTNLKSAMSKAAQKLDEKNISPDNRHVVLAPAQYWLLFNDGVTSNIANRDVGGAGSIRNGDLPGWAGLQFHKSNNLPNGVNVTTGITITNNNTYSGDFTTSVAQVFHPAATGVLKLMDLATESAYLIQNQGTAVVAKMAIGMGILRPEAAVEIKTA